MARTSDKKREETIFLYLGEGYTDKIDQIKTEKNLKVRPQVIEMLVDNDLGDINYNIERKKLNNKISEYEELIKECKENLIKLDQKEGEFNIRKELQKEKLKDKLKSVRNTLTQLNLMKYTKEELILRGKNLSIAFGIPFSEIQKIIDDIN